MYEKVNQFKNDSYFESFCSKNIIFNIRQKKNEKKETNIF